MDKLTREYYDKHLDGMKILRNENNPDDISVIENWDMVDDYISIRDFDDGRYVRSRTSKDVWRALLSNAWVFVLSEEQGLFLRMLIREQRVNERDIEGIEYVLKWEQYTLGFQMNINRIRENYIRYAL